jgi:hypothetical protein
MQLRVSRCVWIMPVALIAAAFALGLSVPCVADDYLRASTMDTVQLVDSCRKAGDPLRIDCAGYILGVFDQMVFSRLICPQDSSGLTAQAVAIALKSLNDHPERWNQSPVILIGQSFKAAFSSCDKS